LLAYPRIELHISAYDIFVLNASAGMNPREARRVSSAIGNLGLGFCFIFFSILTGQPLSDDTWLPPQFTHKHVSLTQSTGPVT